MLLRQPIPVPQGGLGVWMLIGEQVQTLACDDMHGLLLTGIDAPARHQVFRYARSQIRELPNPTDPGTVY